MEGNGEHLAVVVVLLRSYIVLHQRPLLPPGGHYYDHNRITEETATREPGGSGHGNGILL